MSQLYFYTFGFFVFVLFPLILVEGDKKTKKLLNAKFLQNWPRQFVVPLTFLCGIFVVGLTFLTLYLMIKLVSKLDGSQTNADLIRQLILGIPVCITAIGALIALPITLQRLEFLNRQTSAEEEGLITDRINAAVLGLGAEKTVKTEMNGQSIERTEPNIEVRIGAILALERIAQKNLDVHIQIMEMIIAYVNTNAKPSNSSGGNQSEEVPRQDVQIAFDMIGRRTEEQYDLEIKLEKCFIIKDAYLVGLNLENGNCENLEFHHCDLSDAIFPFFAPDRIYIFSCNLSDARIYIGEYGKSTQSSYYGPKIYRSLINIHHTYAKKCWDQEFLDCNFATASSMPSGDEQSVPKHWLPAGTPDEQVETAWKAWLLCPIA